VRPQPQIGYLTCHSPWVVDQVALFLNSSALPSEWRTATVPFYSCGKAHHDSLPTQGLRHVYLPVCGWKIQVTSKWQHPGAPLYSDGRAEEFKKSSTLSTILGLQHVYYPDSVRKSQVTSSRHIAVCLVAKDLMKLLYICMCVFLIYDFRVRVSLRM